LNNISNLKRTSPDIQWKGAAVQSTSCTLNATLASQFGGTKTVPKGTPPQGRMAIPQDHWLPIQAVESFSTNLKDAPCAVLQLLLC